MHVCELLPFYHISTILLAFDISIFEITLSKLIWILVGHLDFLDILWTGSNLQITIEICGLNFWPFSFEIGHFIYLTNQRSLLLLLLITGCWWCSCVGYPILCVHASIHIFCMCIIWVACWPLSIRNIILVCVCTCVMYAYVCGEASSVVVLCAMVDFRTLLNIRRRH